MYKVNILCVESILGALKKLSHLKEPFGDRFSKKRDQSLTCFTHLYFHKSDLLIGNSLQ